LARYVIHNPGIFTVCTE